MKKLLSLIIKIIKYLKIKISNKLALLLFVYKYRKVNQHNDTIPTRIFPLECVEVGKHTYGALNVFSYSNGLNERLSIGNMVSIAQNVQFILGGHHRMDTITTFPLRSLLKKEAFSDAFSKGAIKVEDEVWIGYGAIILSGVKIAKGAIISAGAVVTKNVEPYTIVGGNPAKIIRYRFTSELRKALEYFSLSDIDDTLIIENIDEFYRPLNLALIEKIKKLQ